MSTQIDKFTVGTEDELKSVNMRHANVRVSGINYENPDEIPILDTDVEEEQGNYSYLKHEQISLYNLIANKIDEAIEDQLSNNETTTEQDKNPIESIMKAYPNTGIETLKMSVDSVIDDTLKFDNEEITQAILKHITNKLEQ